MRLRGPDGLSLVLGFLGVGLALVAIALAASGAKMPAWAIDCIAGLGASLIVGALAIGAYAFSGCMRFTVARTRYRWKRHVWKTGRSLKDELLAIAVPSHETDEHDLGFTTPERGKRMFVPTADENPPPIGLRFVEPVEQNITHAPADVMCCGRRVLRVEQFHSNGFTIGDYLPGVEIHAEVTFRRDARP
jgi:hypothetical protein